MDEETSNLENCCEGNITSSTTLVNNDSDTSVYRLEDKNGVSGVSTINGTLCWTEFTGEPIFAKDYTIKFKDIDGVEIDKLISLEISYSISEETSSIFNFLSEDGKCYQADFMAEDDSFFEKSIDTNENIIYEIGQSQDEVCVKGIIFNGNDGGYANINYTENPPEITFEVYFIIHGHNNATVGDVESNSQFIVFQENNRDDNKNGAFYAKYISETEDSGKIVVGVQKDNEDEFFTETESQQIKLNYRYMLHAVIANDKITIYLDGNKISSIDKSAGIDYDSENTIHLGRKRAIKNQSDAFMNGQIHSFYLYGKAFTDNFIRNLTTQHRVNEQLEIINPIQ